MTLERCGWCAIARPVRLQMASETAAQAQMAAPVLGQPIEG
jgi:hypothetical protein